MRRHVHTPPPPVVDAATLQRADALAQDLAAIAAPFRLKPREGETLGCAAYRKARAIEVSSGYSPRSRALQSIASAGGAIQRLRESASAGRTVETVSYRAGMAVKALAEARRYVDEALKREAPIAAE